MAHVSPDRLVDYIFIVGPSTKLPDPPSSADIPSLSPTSPPPDDDWQNIFQTKSSVLWRHPTKDIPDQPLTDNVIYFCQPEGHCSIDTENTITHYFMLTNTETNIRTYGTCISFPYLTDPLVCAQSPNWKRENKDTVAIQEWGVLTVCVLSRCDNFLFFEQALNTLIHFVDNFFDSDLSWDLIIHSAHVSSSSRADYFAVLEVTKWVESLLALPVPKPGVEVMEVELEVNPAVLIGYPPSSRFPFVDLPIYYILQKLDVHLVIEIYKLLLLEHKVIIHSQDYSFVSQCVLTILRLFYPLQYLFPVIPLLPTCLPNAENLLLVPTPFFIGVSTSFVKKISTIHRAETWVIDLDNKKMESPTQQDLDLIDSFPLTLFQLQADIREALDSLKEKKRRYINNSDLPRIYDETDILIRIAFVEFIMGPEMLGHLDSHLTIFRLFPRPVVNLRQESFLASYSKGPPDNDTRFITYFMQSQSVEYFMEWILNPSNKAFEEIRKGFCEIERVGDKLYLWMNRTSPRHLQFTLYSLDLDSPLYQEMLSHKAQQVSNRSLSSSLSSLSGYSDYDDRMDEDTSSYYSDEESSLSIAPETSDYHVETVIAITGTSPSPNETFLSFQDTTTSTNDHVPLPPETSKELIEKEKDSKDVLEKPEDSVSKFLTPIYGPSIVIDSVNNTTPYLTPSPQREILLSSTSEESTKVRRKSLGTPEPEANIPRVGSWMNLRGPLVEMMEFSVSNSNQDSTDTGRMLPTSPTIVRSVPWSAVSSLHELETQIKEIVGRIGAGHGLPWPKPVALKTIASDERSRVALIRLLELRLGVRKQTNLLLSANGEIVPVIVSRSVYKGVLDLLRYISQYIESTLQSNIDTPLFSVFLMFRLALCLCTTHLHKKSTKLFKDKSTLSEMSGRVSPVPSLTASFSSERYNSDGEDIESRLLLPPEIELQEMMSPDETNDTLATPACRRVRPYEPSLQNGIESNSSNEYESDFVYLHSDFLKGLSNAMKGIIVKKQFWNSLFCAVVQADRKYLGWNEKTAEMYDRYNSLPVFRRQAFGYEEDTLLSIVLHNVLIFLLMVGISPGETMDICHRISARTRLATVEEKLLQVTMNELEKADRNNGVINISNLAVLALYSERHPVVTYIVHHGISVTAPIFKLQITDEVCILRRFPDERITCRFWNDLIFDVCTNDNRHTVTFCYQEEMGDYYHHFHSKQYNELYQCLQILVGKNSR